MLSSRGQVGLEASEICPRPRVFVLNVSNFSFWHCEIVCNASISNISEFAMVS